MMCPPAFQHFRRLETVHTVVHKCVQQIPHHEPWEENINVITNRQFEQEKIKSDDKRCRDWRHKQFLSIPGKFVVNTMRDVMKTLNNFRFVYKMQNVAMHDILKKCPGKYAKQKYADDYGS